MITINFGVGGVLTYEKFKFGRKTTSNYTRKLYIEFQIARNQNPPDCRKSKPGRLPEMKTR